LDVFLDGFFARLLKVFSIEDEKSQELIFEIILGSMKVLNNKWKDFFLNYAGFLTLFQVLKTAKSKALILSSVQFFKILLNSKVNSAIFQSFVYFLSKIPEILILIEPALRLFVEFFLKLSLKRQNLLFSAILDAFKFIYEEKIQSHISVLVNINQLFIKIFL